MERNLSREALGDRVGISSKFLWEIESGKKGFSAEVLIRMEDALLSSCQYIMTGKKNENEDELLIKYLKRIQSKNKEELGELFRLLHEMCVDSCN